MKRLLTAVLCLLPLVALGQSSPNWPTGYRPSSAEFNAEWASKQDVNSKFALYAVNFGVKADGVTPDGLAMTAAVTACSQHGTTLQLPAGSINMDGQTVPMPWNNCFVQGVSVSNKFGAPSGTTLLLKSTSIIPFICGTGARLSGVNLYWPNQINGTTVYPPAIADDGTTPCAHNTIDNVVVVNAYDFVKQVNAGFGDWKFYNITGWTVHDLFQIKSTGDSFAFNILRLTPGPWLDICTPPNPCNTTVRAAIDAASLNNTVLHITNTAGRAAVVVSMGQVETEAWRYGVLIDNGGVLTGSVIDALWDGTGTLIDGSSGGVYQGNNQFRGSNSFCGHAIFSGGAGDDGNTPCFKLGANTQLFLDGFKNDAARGDFAQVAGGILNIKNSVLGSIGSRADGTDYYLINMTAPAQIALQNNELGGVPSNVHSHGINTGANVPVTMTVMGNSFINFNEALNIQAASNQITRIIGNVSQQTTGASTVTVSGNNQVSYSGNAWDKPPTATIGACGSSPSIHGAFAGFVTIGTSASCAFTLPWVPLGAGGGACVFTVASGTQVVAATPAGTPPTWTLSFAAPFTGNVFYNCQGQQ